jgi:hypothetical protein
MSISSNDQVRMKIRKLCVRFGLGVLKDFKKLVILKRI